MKAPRRKICRPCGTLALLLLGACAALGDAPAPTCRSLSETLDHPRWLCLPMSRLVVSPTYGYLQALPQAPPIGGGATDLAYYVGAGPVRLPVFLSWQMAGTVDRAPAVMGLNLGLTAAEWRAEGVSADFTRGRARLAPTGTFGCLTRTVTVDLDRTPSLLIQIPKCQGGWALKANDGGEAVDIALVPDTGAAGETIADVSAATGWHGAKTFALKLFAIGGPSKTLTCSRLQFVALPPAPASAARRFLWEPHRLVSALSFGGGSAQAECTTALPDAQTVSQRLRVTRAGSGRLRLTGRFPDGTIQWDAAHRTLLLRGKSYHVALALSRPTRWLGVRPSVLDWQTVDRRTGPGMSGVWALEWDGVKAGEEIVVAARFAPTSTGADATRAAARSAATPRAFAAALTRQEAAWDKRLASVPRPLDFAPRAVDPKGVSAADARRSYGRAWVFFIADTLPPMPENGFPYPQVCAGKPSLWTDGAPHSEETAAWDSATAMQALALTAPDAAWEAAEGLMSQVGPDGYLAGEALPAVFAQTFWLLYRQTGDLARLRRVYPAWKRYTAWKIARPHWVYPNKSRADVGPSAQKDNEFVVHEILDMGYAVKIAGALGMPGEAASWQEQRRQAVTDYRRWFLPPGGVVYRIYASDTDRGGADEVWGVKGLGFASALLPPPARDSLLAVFRRGFSLSRPFGITQNRFGDIEPITLGLFRSGQSSYARLMADMALRDVSRAGEFSEDYAPGDPPLPSGVRPSSFGARLMMDAAFWHNGVVLDEGLPVLLGMPGAAGVDDIPVRGGPVSVRFDWPAHAVTLRGPGLARLRLPPGFRAVRAGGSLRWAGPVHVGQEIKLEAGP